MLPMPFGNPRTYAGHAGVDFPKPSGSLVRASGAGRVTSRGFINARAGNGVTVQYDNGPLVLYCHYNSLAQVPPVTSRVGYGTPIGEVGYSGNVVPKGPAGSHLHMEIMSGSGAHTFAGIWRHFTRDAVVGAPSSGPAGISITNAREDQDMIQVRVNRGPIFTIAPGHIAHAKAGADVDTVKNVISVVDERHELNADQFWNLLDAAGVPRDVVRLHGDGTADVKNPTTGAHEAGGLWRWDRIGTGV